MLQYSAVWLNWAVRFFIYSAVWLNIQPSGFVFIRQSGFGHMDKLSRSGLLLISKHGQFEKGSQGSGTLLDFTNPNCIILRRTILP